MTDTMRERMITAIDTATAEWVKAQGGDKGMADMPTEVLVDAILSVLETPSEAVVQAGEDDGGHSVYRWSAMVKAIRDGA